VGEHSSIWKVWAWKDDVYLASRGMGGDLKVSIHGSGQCQLSATSAVIASLGIANQMRHTAMWRRPDLDASGRCRALQLILPRSEMRSRAATCRPSRPATFLPLPAITEAAVVDLILAGSGPRPGVELSPPLLHLGTLSLASGGVVALGWRIASLGPRDLQVIESLHEILIPAPPIGRSEGLAWGYISSPQAFHALIEFVPTLATTTTA